MGKEISGLPISQFFLENIILVFNKKRVKTPIEILFTIISLEYGVCIILVFQDGYYKQFYMSNEGQNETIIKASTSFRKILKNLLGFVLLVAFISLAIIYHKGEGSLVSEFSVHLATAIILGFIVILLLNREKKIDHDIANKALLEESSKDTGKHIAELKKDINENIVYQKIDTIETIDDKIKKLGDKINNIHRAYNNSCYCMSIEDGLSIATNRVNGAVNKILALGTGKSEVPEEGTKDENGERVNNIIKGYWNKTEEVIKSRKIIYERITSYTVSPDFKTHLEECLKANDPYDSDDCKCRVLIMDDFAVANTFLIIDDDFLFISPTSLSRSSNSISHICFITEDRDIVRRYQTHFTDIYRKARTTHKEFVSATELRNQLKDLGDLMEDADTLKEYSTKLSKYNEWKKHYGRLIIKEAYENLEKLAKNDFKIAHKNSYTYLFHSIKFFLQELKPGHTYETVTFVDFWDKLFKDNISKQLFIDANRSALGKNIKISRTLVINDTATDEANFRESARLAIEQNMALMYIKEGAYQFRILFTKDSSFYTRLFDFARITMDDIGIIIRPIDEKDNNSETRFFEYNLKQAKTELSFDIANEYGKVESEIIDYQNKLKKQEKGEIIASLNKLNLSGEIINTIIEKKLYN